MHLQNFNYNGTVIQRRDDGFVSLTQMCQANGKRIDNWLRLKQTQEYIDALTQSLTSEVLESDRGGDQSGGVRIDPYLRLNSGLTGTNHPIFRGGEFKPDTA